MKSPSAKGTLRLDAGKDKSERRMRESSAFSRVSGLNRDQIPIFVAWHTETGTTAIVLILSDNNYLHHMGFFAI